MKPEELDAIKIRANKYLNPRDILYSDIQKLCESILSLRKENTLLHQNVFELEQQVPEAEQWQNVIANKLEKALLSTDGKDYYEINNSINNVTFTLSIQKKHGKTPVQLLRQSEIRRLKAAQKIVNLAKEVKNLKSVCHKYNIELKVFNNIGKPSIDNELVATNNLNITINNLNKIISQHNSTVTGRQLSKLHVSVQKMYQEIASSASALSWRSLSLKEENIKLKKEILKRKFPRCRIYRKRRRRGTKRRLTLHL